MLLPEDLLSLLIGALVVDTLFLGLNYARIVFVSDELTRWYTTCRASAMAMDVLVIVLCSTAGMRLARAVRKGERPPSAWADLACIVGVQLVHDVAFAAFFRSVPRGALVFDIFKDYADEVHVHALWSDSLMVVGTYLIARAVSGASSDAKLLALASAAYVSQYVLYSK